MKKKAIVIEATRGKFIDNHILYDEKSVERREKRLISEGWSIRRLKNK